MIEQLYKSIKNSIPNFESQGLIIVVPLDIRRKDLFDYGGYCYRLNKDNNKDIILQWRISSQKGTLPPYAILWIGNLFVTIDHISIRKLKKWKLKTSKPQLNI